MAELAAPEKDRRLSPRRPPRGVLKAVCQREPLDLGPNLALAVLDLSETGARLVLKDPLAPGRKVYVNLEGTAAGRPVLRGADVVWSLPMADGAYCVGVRFHKRLLPGDLLSLT